MTLGGTGSHLCKRLEEACNMRNLDLAIGCLSKAHLTIRGDPWDHTGEHAFKSIGELDLHYRQLFEDDILHMDFDARREKSGEQQQADGARCEQTLVQVLCQQTHSVPPQALRLELPPDGTLADVASALCKHFQQGSADPLQMSIGSICLKESSQSIEDLHKQYQSNLGLLHIQFCFGPDLRYVALEEQLEQLRAKIANYEAAAQHPRGAEAQTVAAQCIDHDKLAKAANL
eukprot:2974673-Amphidinium_carterae.1